MPKAQLAKASAAAPRPSTSSRWGALRQTKRTMGKTIETVLISPGLAKLGKVSIVKRGSKFGTLSETAHTFTYQTVGGTTRKAEPDSCKKIISLTSQSHGRRGPAKTISGSIRFLRGRNFPLLLLQNERPRSLPRLGPRNFY